MRFPPPLRIGIPLVLLLFGALVGWVSHESERKSDREITERTVLQRAHFLGTHLATMCAYFTETSGTAGAYRELALAATSPDLRHALVFDASDRVIFSTRFDMVGRALSETPAFAHAELLRVAREGFSAQTKVIRGEPSLVGAYPFPMGGAEERAKLRTNSLGLIFLDYDLSYPNALAYANRVERLWVSGGILLGLCIIFTLIFHRMVTSRVSRLAGVSNAVAAGNLDARANLRGPDELSKLGRTFDKMAAELQKRDAELRESEQRFRQLADNVAEVFWLLDLPSGQFLYVSPAFETLFGRTIAEVMADPNVWRNAIHPEDRERVLDALKHLGEAGMNEDYRIVLGDGSIRWIRDRSFPVREATGAARRAAGVATDVTVRRLAREERETLERKLQETQRLESLGVLAGGIAHDFNNLLTGVLGNTSLARMHLPENHQVQKHLLEVEAVAIRAADLCKQMLAYSGQGRFEVQLLDLNTLVMDTTHLLQLSVTKNAVLNFALSSGLPPIQADPTQVRQVIMNLVINASEAMDGRIGTIAIGTGVRQVDPEFLKDAVLSPELPNGDYVYLEVRDTGQGMSSETLARIFEPFYTTKFTGRGLGLSAVLGIVRGHRGALKVTSTPGKGTSFTLLFPAAMGTARPVEFTAPVVGQWTAQGTVLVVDDEPVVRMVTAEIVEDLGFKVVMAADGIEALARFHEYRVEIVAVLMDLTMPNLDGEQTFRQLRAIEPTLRIILMSGYNEQEAVDRFAGEGLSGFLQKPFTRDALQRKLQQLFGAVSLR